MDKRQEKRAERNGLQKVKPLLEALKANRFSGAVFTNEIGNILERKR